MYKKAILTFLPTPAKSHYVFNLRDFARVIKGTCLVPETRMKETDKLIRLWIHEVCLSEFVKKIEIFKIF